jgi:alpha-mannosidase
VEIHPSGDVGSIYDKELGVELLKAPLELQLMPDSSSKFPAWEMHYCDVMAEPCAVARLLGSRVVEAGPARVAIEVRRAARGSTVIQTISLAAGAAGDRIEIDNRLEWRTWGRMLKASFAVGEDDSEATYDLGLGVIQRGVNRPESYEVPAQQWADLSSSTAGHGVSILNDCKYGWDRPDAGTLRLTLVRSPRSLRGHAHQMTQDWALHRFKYGIYSHGGDWRQGTVWQAARLNRPLRAFRVEPTRRDRPRRLSHASVSSDGVAIQALKRSEAGTDWIVRLQELSGSEQRRVGISLSSPLGDAREVSGVETDVGEASVVDGRLVVDLRPFEPRTFAVRLRAPRDPEPRALSKRLRLPFDIRATSFDGQGGGDLDGRGSSFPGELFPAAITDGGIGFQLGPADAPNCLTCRGQQLPLPEGDWRSVYLLAASADGDALVGFQVGGRETRLLISDYRGPIGRASHRRAVGRVHYGPIRPEFFRRDRIAWTATHLHDREGANRAYELGHLFRYELAVAAVDPAPEVLELPDEPRIRLFAVSVGPSSRVLG